MLPTTIRAGTKDDTDWLYRLFKETNQELIDATWGWEELLQREAFYTNLPGDQFRILEHDRKPIGGYHLERKKFYLWLELLLVTPERHRLGFGTQMMKEIKTVSRSLALPVQLRVLRINPACQFYLAQGFNEIEADNNSLKLEWRADPAGSKC